MKRASQFQTPSYQSSNLPSVRVQAVLHTIRVSPRNGAIKVTEDNNLGLCNIQRHGAR